MEGIFMDERTIYLQNEVVEKPMDSRTLSEYMREFLANEVEPFVQESTYRSYLEGLRSNFYPHPISELTEAELSNAVIEKYYNDLISEKSRRTTEIMVTLVKRLFAYMYAKQFIPKDYAVNVMLPRHRRIDLDMDEARKERNRKRYFTEEDIIKFYEAYRNGIISVKPGVLEWCPVIILQLETFMRAGESLSIFLENVDLNNDLIWVRNTVAKRFKDNDIEKPLEKYIKLPKNGEERVVPLSPLAREVVKKMIADTSNYAVSNDLELLYPALRTGRMRTIEAYERNFIKICNALNIDRDPSKKDCQGRSYGLNTHALRHTGITLANTADGANILNTALMAGHSVKRMNGIDIGSESSYIHAVLPALKNVKTPSMLLGLGEPAKLSKEDQVKSFINDLRQNTALVLALKTLFEMRK